MKNVTLLCLAAGVLGLSAIVPARAQTGSPNATPPTAASPITTPHKGHHGNLAKMAQKLGLSADQVSKIKSIREDAKSRVASVKSSGQVNPVVTKQSVAAIHKDSRARVMQVLTPAQRRELKAMRKAKKA